MSLRYRLLCWLGVHHWTYSAGTLIADDLVSRVKSGERCCLRCGKVSSRETIGHNVSREPH